MSAVFDIARQGGPGALAARARLELLFDPGTYRPVRSAVGDGVLAGSGRVHGRVVCAWAQDGGHKGGSLGARGGETIAATVRRADGLGVPVVGFPHSGGARLQEGAAALHAYADVFRAQSLARVPQVSVVSGPCAGGAAYSPALGRRDGHGRRGRAHVPHGPVGGGQGDARGDQRRRARRHARAGPQRRRAPDRRRRRAGGRARPHDARPPPRPRGRAAAALRAARPGARRPGRGPARAAGARGTRAGPGLRRARRSPRGSSTAARCSSSRRAGRATSSSAWPASKARRSASSRTSRATSAAAWTPTRRRRAPGSSGSATATGSRSSSSSTPRASCPGSRRSRPGSSATAPASCGPSRPPPRAG